VGVSAPTQLREKRESTMENEENSIPGAGGGSLEGRLHSNKNKRARARMRGEKKTNTTKKKMRRAHS